ncbi:MAG: hypothetical protein P8Y03_31205, partial [Anaerolineales bacterium]
KFPVGSGCALRLGTRLFDPDPLSNCPKSRVVWRRFREVWNQADALLSESVSRGSCWRAPVSDREPIVTEGEPAALLVVSEREPKPEAVGEPGGLCLRAATATGPTSVPWMRSGT